MRRAPSRLGLVFEVVTRMDLAAFCLASRTMEIDHAFIAVLGASDTAFHSRKVVRRLEHASIDTTPLCDYVDHPFRRMFFTRGCEVVPGVVKARIDMTPGNSATRPEHIPHPYFAVL